MFIIDRVKKNIDENSILILKIIKFKEFNKT